VSDRALPPIIGVSAAIRRAVTLIERYAATGLAVLLVGATGTGKELFARHVHHRSRRRGNLVDVDCGALPRDMVEGLLFGHERGAFTGATDSRRGLIEASDRGTLFLDELTSLTEEGQRKLLRVLETGTLRPLGDTDKRHLDLRVVAAVQDDASDRLRAGTLRRDLYERVSGVVVHLPPLAQRPEDIVALARYFASLQGRVVEVAGERTLLEHSWPGNVRELRKVIERAVPMVGNGTLPRWALLEAITLGMPDLLPPGDRVAKVADGIREILDAGQAHGWRPRDMAPALGLHRSGLYARLKRFGVSLQDLHQSTKSTGRPVDSVDSNAAPRR
jgi:transcriptional regulator with PAS, ATPase and Fis domain